MKKAIVITGLFLSGFLLTTTVTTAQLRVNLNVNLSNQPAWGPVGYDHVDYYYLPDVDSYYDVRRQEFIYQSGGRWVFAHNLPGRYRNYDLYRGYKVVVNEPRPYLRANVYRQKYGRYKGNHEGQVIIRDSREEKYYIVKGHPMHHEWEQKHGRQRGRH